MTFVTHGRGCRVDREAEILTEDGCDPREGVDADMRRRGTLDP